MVDAASVEGRDPVNDIRKINAELEAYNPELLKKPQVIAANKIDALYDGDSTYIDLIKEEFDRRGLLFIRYLQSAERVSGNYYMQSTAC